MQHVVVLVTLEPECTTVMEGIFLRKSFKLKLMKKVLALMNDNGGEFLVWRYVN